MKAKKTTPRLVHTPTEKEEILSDVLSELSKVQRELSEVRKEIGSLMDFVSGRKYSEKEVQELLWYIAQHWAEHQKEKEEKG